MTPSPLVQQFLALAPVTDKYPLLDLACGGGRNGRHCLEQGYSVVFADRNKELLDEIQAGTGPRSKCWQVDFEQSEQETLTKNSYQAILVFRYLHRPLMAAIKDAIVPGGYIVYETFTLENRQFGRPNNSDFLLQANELQQCFAGWEVLHSFEGENVSETSGKPQAIAQIIARKPL